MPNRDAKATHRLIRLRDGRRLSYAQYGDPDGFPILNAHGGLTCRLDVASAAPIAERCGIRLISPDRPGVGRSDPQHGRTILDWSSDIVELLEVLHVDTFAVMGWSLGGQYAAAVAYALPQRVTRAAIIAGVLPLTESGEVNRLPAIDRTYVLLSRQSPWCARQCFRAMRLAAIGAPGLYGWLAAQHLGDADDAVLKAEGYGTFAHMSQEALCQPGGVVEEYRAMVRLWGFAPEDISVPVDVWAGDDDRLTDPSWPRELARRIPRANLHLRAGGHFLAHRYYPDIFESLRN